MERTEATGRVGPREKILLTRSTGYIGGRLLRRLEADSCPVRCLVRRPEVLGPQVAATTEVAGGDLLKPETLPAAMRGITTAYYLVHSMASDGGLRRPGSNGRESVFLRSARRGRPGVSSTWAAWVAERTCRAIFEADRRWGEFSVVQALPPSNSGLPLSSAPGACPSR